MLFFVCAVGVPTFALVRRKKTRVMNNYTRSNTTVKEEVIDYFREVVIPKGLENVQVVYFR